MSEFKAIETQEELDKILSDRIKRAERKAREEAIAQFSDYDDLKKQIEGIEAIKTEHQKELDALNEKISGYEGEIAKFKRTELVRTAVKEYGMDYDKVSGFITGDDEASIKASAEALSQIVPRNSSPAPLRNPESTSTVSPWSSVLDSMK